MHTRTRELLDYLDAQHAILRSTWDSVPPHLRETKPAADRWSAANVVEHLAIVEDRVAGRMQTLIAEARAQGAGPDPSTAPILPMLRVDRVLDRTTRVSATETVLPKGLCGEDAWSALESATTNVRDALRAGDGIDLGAITMPHPIFGPLSFYEWFAFLGAHEARHAAQIREDLALG